jgi:hypothetical protein
MDPSISSLRSSMAGVGHHRAGERDGKPEPDFSPWLVGVLKMVINNRRHPVRCHRPCPWRRQAVYCRAFIAL